MRSILILAIVLIPMTILSGQRKIEVGVVSMVNTSNYYYFGKEGSDLISTGFSFGLKSAYYLNDRFLVTASLLYTRMDFSGNIMTDCIGLPGVYNSDKHDHVEVFSSVRYLILKEKWVMPYISAGFIQGSRSGKYMQVDVEANSSETNNRQIHFSYNYGAIASIGACVKASSKLSFDIEGSVRYYAKQPSLMSPHYFISPTLGINYRIR